MKLYFATGTCSLSPRIVAEEAGITLDADRVNIGVNPHRTSAEVDFSTIHPNGYVPALELDDGSLLTEGAAIVQYLADQNPGATTVASAAHIPAANRLKSGPPIERTRWTCPGTRL
jgi:glutathione S-transferase